LILGLAGGGGGHDPESGWLMESCFLQEGVDGGGSSGDGGGLETSGGKKAFAEAGLIASLQDWFDAEAVDVCDQEFDGIGADIDDGPALAGGWGWGYDVGGLHGSCLGF